MLDTIRQWLVRTVLLKRVLQGGVCSPTSSEDKVLCE